MKTIARKSSMMVGAEGWQLGFDFVNSVRTAASGAVASLTRYVGATRRECGVDYETYLRWADRLSASNYANN